jgi:hypothetical protein
VSVANDEIAQKKSNKGVNKVLMLKNKKATQYFELLSIK